MTVFCSNFVIQFHCQLLYTVVHTFVWGVFLVFTNRQLWPHKICCTHVRGLLNCGARPCSTENVRTFLNPALSFTNQCNHCLYRKQTLKRRNSDNVTNRCAIPSTEPIGCQSHGPMMAWFVLSAYERQNNPTRCFSFSCFQLGRSAKDSRSIPNAVCIHNDNNSHCQSVNHSVCRHAILGNQAASCRYPIHYVCNYVWFRHGKLQNS